MKSKKIIAIILILIGGVTGYYVVNRDKNVIDTSKNKNSDSALHFNHETTPTGMGAKPEKNSDGSVKIVEEFIKLNAQNPATFEFLEWSEVSAEGGYWKVRCKYSGISSFDKEVTTNAWFYIQNNKVVYTKIISKI